MPTTQEITKQQPLQHMFFDVDKTLLGPHMSNNRNKQQQFVEILHKAEQGNSLAKVELKKYFRDPDALHPMLTDLKKQGTRFAAVTFTPYDDDLWGPGVIQRALNVVYPRIFEHVAAHFPELPDKDKPHAQEIINDFVAKHSNYQNKTDLNKSALYQTAFKIKYGKSKLIEQAQKAFIKNDHSAWSQNKVNQEWHQYEKNKMIIPVLIDDDALNLQHHADQRGKIISAAKGTSLEIVNELKRFIASDYKQGSVAPYPKKNTQTQSTEKSISINLSQKPAIKPKPILKQQLDVKPKLPPKPISVKPKLPPKPISAISTKETANYFAKAELKKEIDSNSRIKLLESLENKLKKELMKIANDVNDKKREEKCITRQNILLFIEDLKKISVEESLPKDKVEKLRNLMIDLKDTGTLATAWEKLKESSFFHHFGIHHSKAGIVKKLEKNEKMIEQSSERPRLKP